MSMRYCTTATRLISDDLDRRLTWLERLDLNVHLLGCTPCRRFRRAVHLLQRVVTSAADESRLSEGARARIRKAIELAADGEH
jgi:predicted anti-sigma-YlaC factor YlaD